MDCIAPGCEVAGRLKQGCECSPVFLGLSLLHSVRRACGSLSAASGSDELDERQKAQLRPELSV